MIKFTFSAPQNEPKPWARDLTGFDREQVGGFALLGSQYNVETLGQGPLVLGVATTPAHALVYLGLSVQLPGAPIKTRFGMLCQHAPGVGMALQGINLGAGVTFDVSGNETIMLFAVSDHETFVPSQNGLVADTLAWYKSLKLDRALYPACRNPHYRAGAVALAQGLIKPATAKPKEPASSDLIGQTQGSLYDKGSEIVAQVMNRGYKLPDGYSWAGRVGGLWLAKKGASRQWVVALLGKHMVEIENSFMLVEVLDEQAHILGGLHGLTEAVQSYMEMKRE